MEPETVRSVETIGKAALTAWASKELLSKLLGPTAEYLGGEVAHLAAKCNVNLTDIFTRAARKLGDRLDDPGQVNPRVLRGVIQEGAFVEDSVASEYFGGALASARTHTSRDDRSVSMVGLIKELSVYEIRFHYICYTLFKRIFDGRSPSIAELRGDSHEYALFMPGWVFSVGMEFGPDEPVEDVRAFVFYALRRHNLIGSRGCFGPPDFLSEDYEDIDESGMVIRPSAFGAELYAFAHGRPDVRPDLFLNENVRFEDFPSIEIPDGSKPVRPIRRTNDRG